MEKAKTSRKSAFWMKIVLALVVLVFIGVIVSNGVKQYFVGQYMANMPAPINPVTAITLEAKDWTPTLATTGVVRANRGAMLSVETSGTVSEILVHSGQAVKKGQLLVSLDSAVEQANLHATQAQLPLAKQTYERYQKLYKTRSVSQQELDNAKAKYDALVANIEALKAAIARRQVVALFDGVIGIVKVNLGQYVTMGTEIVRLEDRSTMKIDFSLDQNLTHLLEVGQTVFAQADALGDEKITAKITAIEPAINAKTGLIDVQATFDQSSSQKLLSGMFVRLRVALPTKHQQIVVPQVAVAYHMYGESVFRLIPLSNKDKEQLLANPQFAYKDNIDKIYRVTQVNVESLDRQGIYAQLASDELTIGDKIVTTGQQRLSNSSLVIIVDKAGVGTVPPTETTNL